MKKFIVLLFALAIIAGIAVITCPEKEAHKDAILLVVNEYVAEEANFENDDEGFEALMNVLSNGVTKLILNNILIVENHFLYSEGYLSSPEDGSKRVSFGIFGHVFTVNKKQLKEATNSL